MEDFELSYGELLVLYDGLEKLPSDAIFTYKKGDIRFEPILISDVKEKLCMRIEQIEFVNYQMNNASVAINRLMK